MYYFRIHVQKIFKLFFNCRKIKGSCLILLSLLSIYMIEQILFVLVAGVAIYFFAKNIGKIRRNILLGKDIDLSDNSSERWKTMLKVAFGQTKMAARPVPFILHFIVYAGFILINIEVLEILIVVDLPVEKIVAPFKPLSFSQVLTLE